MKNSFGYSKKVMEHFMNPKNMGEIEKADAVGQVGNPRCLLPEEKIHKDSEILEISKLKENEKILTHNGDYEEVIGTSSRGYKGKIITLKNKLGKINLTPEHLVYAIKVSKEGKFGYNKEKRKLIPAWYHAEQLKKGDVVLYPILKKEEDIKFLEIKIPKAKYDFKSKEIPNKIPLNEDLLRLFGYFLAEGHIVEKPCKTYISIALNINERDITEDIKDITKRLFGLEIKFKEELKRKTICIYLYNAKLAKFFKKLFGSGAGYKKLPDFIMNLPTEKQKSLIYGLWKGDGYVNLNRNGPGAGYATISYQLAQQVKTLLLKQKIAPSIYIDGEKEVKGVKHKKAYRIHVGQRDSLKRLCNILKMEYTPKSYEAIKSWFDRDYLYTPVTNKEISNYKGRVHNLEVGNSHSFVSEAFCLHNCGDILKIFLRIKDNRIQDVKFQTLGCPAAIATSDALCELVKGKTLEEIKKIDNKSIIEKLDGLPKLKIHCSVLGAQALKKAIENYEKKK